MNTIKTKWTRTDSGYGTTLYTADRLPTIEKIGGKVRLHGKSGAAYGVRSPVRYRVNLHSKRSTCPKYRLLAEAKARAEQERA